MELSGRPRSLLPRNMMVRSHGRKQSSPAMRIGPPEVPIKPLSRNMKSQEVLGQPRKQPKMLRAGLYARVSTNDQQTLPMQIRALREYVAGAAGPSRWRSARSAPVQSNGNSASN